MSIELFINATPLETRLALKDKGEIQDIYIERVSQPSLVGNIYQAKVVRILPGMQAAFIDIGLAKNAWLKADDIHFKSPNPTSNSNQTFNSNKTLISHLLREGQWLQVQVIKDAIGDKGVQVSTRLTLASRHLVFTPDIPNINISKKIHSLVERQRLMKIVEPHISNNQGFIIRTYAKNCHQDQLIQEASWLVKYWTKLQKQVTKKTQCIYQEVSPAIRFIRDQLSNDVQNITVDNEQVYQSLLEFSQIFWPQLSSKIIFEDDESTQPALFERVGAEQVIEQALLPQVPLPCGGYLIIQQTEAMTTIDINSGSFVGDKSLSQTIVAVNLDAMKVIAQQIRLRQLNGMILIDCIGKMNTSQQKKVKDALVQALKLDQVQTKVYGFTALGLLEVTRQRTRATLEQSLLIACPNCEGLGVINNMETTASHIIRELNYLSNQYTHAKLIVCVSPSLNEWLQKTKILQSLSIQLMHRVQIRVVPSHHTTHFNIVME